MSKQNIRYLQSDNPDEGSLQVNVESASGTLPIENATVEIQGTPPAA